ncbi:MAG: hypothetical protein KGY50_02670 [Candidatus Thermoplasmatota archaeon]|nr:hypothetical protein [Candidatus Thermoplasmatota archaeon]
MNNTQYISILTVFMMLSIILPITVSQETTPPELIDNHNKYISKSDITYTYSIVYIGTISNLQKTDKEIEFDSVRLLRYTHISTSDDSFWSYNLAHYENTHHYHEGYETNGLITNNLIFAKLTKEI